MTKTPAGTTRRFNASMVRALASLISMMRCGFGSRIAHATSCSQMWNGSPCRSHGGWATALDQQLWHRWHGVINDLTRGHIEGLVVVGFETDSDSWGGSAEVLRSPNTRWNVCSTNKLGRTQGRRRPADDGSGIPDIPACRSRPVGGRWPHDHHLPPNSSPANHGGRDKCTTTRHIVNETPCSES